MTGDPTVDANGPKRVLGLFDATCIVIGAIIGVGIFFSPGKVAKLCETPNLALGAWIVAGFVALCGAYAFAELGRRFHGSGAQYAVLHSAWGRLPAFIFVFCNATAVQAGTIAVIAMICARNIAVVADADKAIGAGAQTALACALIGSVTVANIVGAKWGSRIGAISVVCKIAALACIIAVALWLKNSGNAASESAAYVPKESLKGVRGLVAALVPIFFAYGGWQHALWIAGEVKEPRRNLPRAILIGVAIVVLVYVSANWAYLALLGHEGVVTSKTLAADAIAKGTGDAGRRWIAAAVGVSAFGVLNAQLLSGPRLIYAMACEGQFFKMFARLWGTRGTPARAIALLGIAGTAILLAVGMEGADNLTTGVVFIDGIFFALTAAALLKPATGSEGSLPLAKVAAAIFVIGEFGVVTGAYLDPQTRKFAWIGLNWIAIAVALYFLVFKSRQK